MADLQRRGSYTPRRAREQRAYRLVAAGALSGSLGVVGLVLAAVGAIEATIPVLLIVVAILCAVMFRGITRAR